jgi:putative phosphonate metabolism protein
MAVSGHMGEGRVAVYLAPPADHRLSRAGATWLGRNPATGAAPPQPDLPDIAAITAEPRHYGFHATLKPPMRLAPGRTWAELVDATRTLAATIPPFALPPLAVADLRGFLALRETAPCPPLGALADACVAALDEFRAPPSAAELARRRGASLTAAQDAMLTRWGYPYVFDDWFFHMTLTRRLTAAERAVFLPAARAFFAPALAEPLAVTELCLFAQPSLDAPFVVAERLALRGVPRSGVAAEPATVRPRRGMA